MSEMSKRDGRDSTGSVMLEFVIAFPIVFTLILAVVQIAHIWVARLVVHYAAYCGARAALVHVCEESGPSVHNDSWPRRSELGHEGLDAAYCNGDSIADGLNGLASSEAEWTANKAAAVVCSWSVMGGSDDANTSIPGWGDIPGSDAASRKTRAVVEFDPDTWNVEATVEHDFALITPIVGPMIAWGMNPWDKNRPWAVTNSDITGNVHADMDLVRYPHIRLKETVWLPKPYRTVIAARNWQGYR